MFGDVIHDEMILSNVGQIAHKMWLTIAEHRPNIELDAFVVMPNHVHGILFIFDQPQSNVGLKRASAAAQLSRNISKGAHLGSLSAIIGGYKSVVTRHINQEMGLLAPIVWQESFHDHIIRNEQSYNYIREYVHNNPARWEKDTFYK